MAANFALGVLEVYSLIRFRDDIDWNHANGWIYLVVVIAVGLLGAYGWFEATRPISSDQRAG